MKTSQSIILRLSNDNETDMNDIDKEVNASGSDQDLISNDMGLEIIRGGGSDISDETWRDIQDGAPGKWEVMKNVSFLVLCTCVV